MQSIDKSFANNSEEGVVQMISLPRNRVECLEELKRLCYKSDYRAIVICCESIGLERHIEHVLEKNTLPSVHINALWEALYSMEDKNCKESNVKNEISNQKYNLNSKSALSKQKLESDIEKNLNVSLQKTNSTSLYTAILDFKISFVYDNVLFVSSDAIVSKYDMQQAITVKKSKNYLRSLDDVDVGDYVVHRDNGIGLFDGLIEVNIGNVSCECMQIVYADGKLYVPLEKIYTISKHASKIDIGEDTVELDSLNSKRWENVKKKAQKTIDEIALRLLRIAGERKTVKATIYNIDERKEKMEELSKSFKHIETDDQIAAVIDIMNDLASEKVMDRLICGDVGFGKTEVAVRAIFNVVIGKMINSNYAQVAVLCPTVFLSMQNYSVIQSRLSSFGICVAVLHSGLPKRKQDEIKEQVASGKIDVLVGTHSILSGSVHFKNLNLIVCDEEQTFGVEQKEKLKEKKADIHYLSLSATPIPRTLHRALSGIQDISIIGTAPRQKLSIKTSIVKLNNGTIKEIIARESAQGGQSIMITPRIAYLEDLLPELCQILPLEKIAILHGEKPQQELMKTIDDLRGNTYELVLATTIIAAGLDFEKNNTIIVHRPNMFGISQLHQIRGRVGRRNLQAYCYLMVDDSTMRDKEKIFRLEKLVHMNNIGNGIEVARYDLDSRGGGNLISKEQSGHIEHISPSLYYDLLNESIKHLEQKSGTNVDFMPNISINLPIHIPNNYIDSVRLRISIYRQIADIKNTNELIVFMNNLEDRFGRMTDKIVNISETVKLREFCIKYRIIEVKRGGDTITIKFDSRATIDAQKAVALAMKAGGNIKISQDNAIAFKLAKLQENIALDIIETIKQNEVMSLVLNPLK